MKKHFFEIIPAEIEEFLLKNEEKSFRVKQIYHWIFQKQVSDFSQMSSLSKSLQNFLNDNFSLKLPEIIDKKASKDGSIKFLLELSDKEKIEMVLIPYLKKNTLCISSQVGCKRNCKFCATAKMGFKRNLSSAEILLQVFLAKLQLDEQKLTNIVFMGMGEPLDNFENVLLSTKLLQHERMFKFSPRRITISTAGVIPGIRKLADSGIKAKLAVSLNSAIQSKREKLMPITKLYPLDKLKTALQKFSQYNPYRITFEYVLIKNFNMGKEDLKSLIKFTGDISCKINLIPWNKVDFLPFEAPNNIEVIEFSEKLKKINSAVTMRISRGNDINAACGQLAIQNK